jgi:hypothetical protein
MSLLAAAYDQDDVDWVDLEFIVANPSSYTYLDERRFTYECGECSCTRNNCTCDQECSIPTNDLMIPTHHGVGKNFPCYSPHYNDWPYGIKNVEDERHEIPYVIKSGPKRAAMMYKHRHMVYLVGQNDTCNDALPTCDASFWKRDVYEEDEWPCFRNSMDTRCPAMLEGPFRLLTVVCSTYYGELTHELHVVEGVGYDAKGMFGSPIAIKKIFEHPNSRR